MNLEYRDYIIDEFRRPLSERLIDYTLTAFLFCTSTFGMVMGALWALGYIDVWMIPQW